MNEYINGLFAVRYTTYLAIAGYALVIADFLHTYPDEVRYMWTAPPNLPLFLFFFLRYGVFIHIGLHIASLFPAVSPEWCGLATQRVGISTTILIAGSEAILFLRVYAFTGRSKRVLAFLTLQATGGLTAAVVLLTRYLQSVQYVKAPIPDMMCVPARANVGFAGGAFAALLANSIVVMLVMMYTAFLKHKKNKSCLFKIFWRDGVVYFILLSILASVNIVVNFTASGHYTFLFVQPEVFLHVILSTRMLLHLRSWASNTDVAPKSSGAAAYPVGGISWQSDPYYNPAPPLAPMHFVAGKDSELSQTTTYDMVMSKLSTDRGLFATKEGVV